nr:MAG TPA: AntA/AntB antirepressor [Caudoviricetes sp.]
MNEIIRNSVDIRTPIEIALDIDNEGMTTARQLYSFLELNPANFSHWCKRNITENEFAAENEDYVRFVFQDETPTGGKIQREDFKLTAHFAKKLSVKGSGAKAEQAREYFTTVEERVRQKAIDRSQLSPQMQMFYAIADEQAKIELEQKRLAEQTERTEQKVNAIVDTFQKADDIEDFQRWANNRLAQIAESPKFDRGYGRSKNYSLAKAESYERLKRKRNCRLDDRVQKAKGRVLEERPDIKRSELQKINKIYVIANDKDLRPAYELVVKEMMMHYCVS